MAIPGSDAAHGSQHHEGNGDQLRQTVTDKAPRATAHERTNKRCKDGCRVDHALVQEGRIFFSEEKNQKTFASGACDNIRDMAG
jgi:hypothetical protein